MAWITPKTNWVSTDKIFVADFNRITGNLAYLKTLSEQIYAYTIDTLPDTQTRSDFPYASELNAIETVLDQINTNTYSFNIGETQTYVANGHPFDYNELNRIESATLKLYETMQAEIRGLPRLALVLGRKQLGMKL